MNRACEHAKAEAGFPDPSCSAEALEREWREARNKELSRSRTPQRQHPLASRPCPPTTREREPNRKRALEEGISHSDCAAGSRDEHERRQLLSGRSEVGADRHEVEEDSDDMALVVKKWVLKKKSGGYIRRLVANPAAWTEGPGVTVTRSTRHLPGGKFSGRGTASSSSDRPLRA